MGGGEEKEWNCGEGRGILIVCSAFYFFPSSSSFWVFLSHATYYYECMIVLYFFDLVFANGISFWGHDGHRFGRRRVMKWQYTRLLSWGLTRTCHLIDFQTNISTVASGPRLCVTIWLAHTSVIGPQLYQFLSSLTRHTSSLHTIIFIRWNPISPSIYSSTFAIRFAASSPHDTPVNNLSCCLQTSSSPKLPPRLKQHNSLPAFTPPSSH